MTLKFDRNEWAGALGDLGTDLPLLVGVTLAAKLDPPGVLMVFGAMQLFTALVYRIPMPVQPLKAMAALVIAQGISGPVLHGAGLAIGLVMLLLAASGGIDRLVQLIPRCVVRGIQLGLGLQLASLAIKEYIKADGAAGYCLAGGVFALTALLFGNRRVPAALLAIAIGACYALLRNTDLAALGQSFGLNSPKVQLPGWQNVVSGFFLLALPQLPLSLGNSVLATRQVAEDLFPEKRITARQIGLTYSLMNLVGPFFGGIPVCHGSGGMVGHYAFGARSGGSVFIYGMAFLIAGLFFGNGFSLLVKVFPLSVLGVLLLFEALSLILLTRDVAGSKSEFPVTIVTGLVACFLPYGFGIGLLIGTGLHALGGLQRCRLFATGLFTVGGDHEIKPT